jgi:hypothetical protein
VSFGGSLVPVFGFVFLGMSYVLNRPAPDEIYVRAFASLPPPTVELIDGQIEGVGDHHSIRLCFRSDRPTIDTLVAQQALLAWPNERVSATALACIGPTPPADLVIFGRFKDGGGTGSTDRSLLGFANEQAVLAFDSSSGRAHYAFVGID